MKTVKLILFLMGMVLISCGEDDNTSYAPSDNTDTPTSAELILFRLANDNLKC